MLDIILPDLPFAAGDEVVALVSGLGATPVMELYILYNKVAEILGSQSITVYRPYIGNYFTSLEMMGVTVTLMKLDDELKELVDMEANRWDSSSSRSNAMQSFSNIQGRPIMLALVQAIQENAAYLSEIDGAIGDGDHGINMNKAVTQTKEKLAGQATDLTTGFKVVSDIMLDDIGGSMGPLYGTFFRQMFRVVRKKENIDAEVFNDMLTRALGSPSRTSAVPKLVTKPCWILWNRQSSPLRRNAKPEKIF